MLLVKEKLSTNVLVSTSYSALSSYMKLVRPALSIKVMKSSRIPAARKKVWQGKVEGCASPSSPSSPNRGVMISSLYEGLVLLDDLGSHALLGASLSNMSPKVWWSMTSLFGNFK